MNKKIKKILSIFSLILIITGVLTNLGIGIYNLFGEGLSTAKMVQEYWPLYLISVGFILCGASIEWYLRSKYWRNK